MSVAGKVKAGRESRGDHLVYSMVSAQLFVLDAVQFLGLLEMHSLQSIGGIFVRCDASGEHGVLSVDDENMVALLFLQHLVGNSAWIYYSYVGLCRRHEHQTPAP